MNGTTPKDMGPSGAGWRRLVKGVGERLGTGSADWATWWAVAPASASAC